MCTALSLTLKSHYFGRNLDLDRTYGEKITVTPRRFPLIFKKEGEITEHFAAIGMTAAIGKKEAESPYPFPLFYDGANEHGLAAAALDFPESAFYPPLSDEPFKNGKKHILAPFEVIPFVLSQCKSVSEAKALLSKTEIANISFGKDLPVTPLHWIFSAKDGSVTVESTKDGLGIYENPVGVLTNEPAFEKQLEYLKKYSVLFSDGVSEAKALLSKTEIANISFGKDLPVTPLHWIFSAKDGSVTVESTKDGLGIYENPVGVLTNEPAFEKQLEYLKKYSVLFSDGTDGDIPPDLRDANLPGGPSSPARFVRIAVVGKRSPKLHFSGEGEAVGQLFHLLSTVEVPKGMRKTKNGDSHFTRYTSCINTERGLYYYTTYGNRRISCVDMYKTPIDGEAPSSFGLLKEESIKYQNTV